jgi:hypothetical protein
MLMNDEWNFKISDFRYREMPRSAQQVQQQLQTGSNSLQQENKFDALQRRVYEHIKVGNVGKAAKLLFEQNSTPDHTEETFNTLKQKHTQPNQAADIVTEAQWQQVMEYENQEELDVDAGDIRQIVRNMKKIQEPEQINLELQNTFTHC